MEAMKSYDFLPSSIDSNIKYVIYGLLLVHSCIFIVWLCLMVPTLNKTKTQQQYIEDFRKKKLEWKNNNYKYSFSIIFFVMNIIKYKYKYKWIIRQCLPTLATCPWKRKLTSGMTGFFSRTTTTPTLLCNSRNKVLPSRQTNMVNSLTVLLWTLPPVCKSSTKVYSMESSYVTI